MKLFDEKSKVEVYTVGECAVTLASVDKVSLKIQQKIWLLADHFRQHPQFTDIVPGMNNLTLYFDSLTNDNEQIMAELLSVWNSLNYQDKQQINREIIIPVNYGGEFGPDLQEVADYHKMSTQEIITRHSNNQYVVFFLGFMPGFVYLGGLDNQLITPRKSSPRLEVPAGSVGIGGAQTGIYPKTSPGGWQLIGRSDAVLFDPNREQPSLLLPGDILRFSINEVYPC